MKRILLVEDNLKDVDLTLAAFEAEQLDVVVDVVRDGAEALDYLRRRGKYASREETLPTVVLLDIKMPKMSGLDVLRAMKADDQLKKLPVVMLTSSKENPDVAESYTLGANAYVVKPVGFEQFAAAVAHIGIFWGSLNEPPQNP